MREKNYEKEAEEFVRLYEKNIGHKTWKPKRGKKIGCDLISTGGYYIEVKSWNRSMPPSSIPIYESIFKHLKKKKKGAAAYYIYLVYDFKNGPKMIRISPSRQKWYETKIRLLNVKASCKDISPIDLSRYK
jgi:hypothetical protein